MTDTANHSSVQQPLATITNHRDKNSNGTTESISPKSPLEFTWTFWYIKPEKRLSWEQSLINLIDIGFVEDFWATFNHLASPSRLAQGKTNSDYYFFKKGGTNGSRRLSSSSWEIHLSFSGFQCVRCGVNAVDGSWTFHLFLIVSEDKANANGGRWLLTCAGQDSRLDDLWLETLLGMIGDCFSHDRYVGNVWMIWEVKDEFVLVILNRWAISSLVVS